MKTSELARAAGVTAETVRHYVRVGLLDPVRDPDNGYRVFDATQLERLRFVRTARGLGFSVDEVVEILDHAGKGETPCPFVRERAQARLTETQARIEALELQRDRLARVLVLWDALPDGVPDGRRVCPLIEQAAREVAGASEDSADR